MTPTHRTIPVRLLPTLAIALSVTVAGLAGCRYETAQPVADVRYRSVGPKEDFPDYLRGTILEVVDVGGVEPQIISGYGVVVNLPNTGADDGIPSPVRERILDTASIRGFESFNTEGPLGELSTSLFLADPKTAIVRVDGIVPPGARRGDRIDVRVSALPNNTTTSLVGGMLYQTELHTGIVTSRSPGERVNKAGVARGNVLINPIFAGDDLTEVAERPGSRQSLRSGLIPDGGIYQGSREIKDRIFVLKLREPGYRTARLIEQRINYHFGEKVAAAQDEGVVVLRMPENFAGQWEHFINLAVLLYRDTGAPEAADEMARNLIDAAVDPKRTPEELMVIGYAWEGLGRPAVPRLAPLLSDPNPAVAFHAARAAASVGDSAGVDALVSIAADPRDPFNVAAAEELGGLSQGMARNTGESLKRRTRELLSAPSKAVRVAAYESLVRLGDKAIVSREIGGQFYLDVVPGKGEPFIYATRTGTPRLAIIGGHPRLTEEAFASVFGARLTVSRDGADKPAVIYHRPVVGQPVQAVVLPEMVELVARLGGQRPSGETGIYLSYGEVLAVVHRLCEAEIVVADGKPVGLVMEESDDEDGRTAPIIPGLEDLQASSKP